ncbi:MAG: hypothetical protein NZT61_04195, partial [Deltaproteobacteria bacterium]|nr:hypothetical protein [Deltaproteobacteria bacterium]
MLSWHIWAILAVGCINLAIGLHSQLSYAGGLGFTLDDAFIHLGVAKSLTDDGVWGINGKFVSVSTSPLWTLLITPLHLAFGYYPLIFHLLSAVFAVGTAVMIYLLIKESLRKPSLGVISGVAYLVFPLSIWATVSGLEIHLTNFLFVLALFLFFKNTHPFLS